MPKGHWNPLTPSQEERIKNEYLEKPVKRLSSELGISFGRVMRFLAKNNLEIPKDVIQKRIKDSYRKKGQEPFNKGLKQSEYMTPESIEKTKNTRFKKGQEAMNSKNNGEIVSRTDNCGKTYQYIRTGKGVWELLQRYVWETHHGKIKDGYVITFIDGDTTNVNISNLKMISRVENMYRNSHAKYPEEIIPSLVLNNQIETKINQLENGK